MLSLVFVHNVTKIPVQMPEGNTIILLEAGQRVGGVGIHLNPYDPCVANNMMNDE